MSILDNIPKGNAYWKERAEIEHGENDILKRERDEARAEAELWRDCFYCKDIKRNPTEAFAWEKDQPAIPTDEERAANHKALPKHKADRFRLMFGQATPDTES